MSRLNLTEQAEWDDYWSKAQLPLEHKKAQRTLYLTEILGVFDSDLPHVAGYAIYTSPARNGRRPR